ncbi:MAG: hypothetical protein ACP5SH_11655, partial [Syntrophobacteraceae bacterium]
IMPEVSCDGKVLLAGRLHPSHIILKNIWLQLREKIMAEMVKKTMEMNQEYIDRLRVIFGVRTEKEAVNRALELALIDDEIINAHRRMREAGNVIESVFE